jgi:hypothetical protein
MDLFDKKLSLKELLHYNNILDDGGVDTDILLIHNSMNCKPWNVGLGRN